MTTATLFDEEPEPIRPYWQDGQPSSGWSGTDTSKASEPGRLNKQKRGWLYLRDAGQRGLTFAELVDCFNDDTHHGGASNVLCIMHQKGRAARLTEVRDGCKVYVLPSLVGDRDTEAYVARETREDVARAAFAAGVMHGYAKAHAVDRQPDFDEWWASTPCCLRP